MTLQPSRNGDLSLSYPQWKISRNSGLSVWEISMQLMVVSCFFFLYQNLICYFSIWLKEVHQQLITYHTLNDLFWVIFFINVRKNVTFVGMPTEVAYTSAHLVLSHFVTCMCSNVETNLPWTCLVSRLLSFEHPSVLLFCLKLLYVLFFRWNMWYLSRKQLLKFYFIFISKKKRYPFIFRPELAFSRADHSRPYSDVAKYIFDI